MYKGKNMDVGLSQDEIDGLLEQAEEDDDFLLSMVEEVNKPLINVPRKGLVVNDYPKKVYRKQSDTKGYLLADRFYITVSKTEVLHYTHFHIKRFMKNKFIVIFSQSREKDYYKAVYPVSQGIGWNRDRDGE